jgi:hypothetical protein
MRTINLTPQEFMLFKQLAGFFYDFSVKAGVIYVIANSDMLESLGY